MYTVSKVRSSTSMWGQTHWLLELDDGRAAMVFWTDQSLIARLADTTIRELWSFEFSRRDSESQVMVRYLPDERSHDWAATRGYLADKFVLPEEEVASA